MRIKAKHIALGGMMSALAVVIMCLGSMIPIATFVCPAIAMIAGQVTLRLCGRRIGWCWYGVVAILSLLMSFDKEAALTFVFLGYYPMIKYRFARCKFGFVWKIVYFNVSIAIMYFLLLHLFDMTELANEYTELGRIGIAIMLIMGNITFFLLDVTLTRFSKRK